jgi:MFS family permease
LPLLDEADWLVPACSRVSKTALQESPVAIDSSVESGRLNTPTEGTITIEERRVIIGSSLGTLFELYDFFLVGTLAAYLSRNFFSGVNPTAAFIFTLLSFAVGFALRPFGALVFGHFGDRIGRKHTFLTTIIIMGLATFCIGLIPGYATIGLAAPILFIGLRLLQGLAIGGEYGGAATYVAENAPRGRRGAYTSWIQTTSAAAIVLSLTLTLVIRFVLGDARFSQWGWRLPFLVSSLLLAVSVWIRLQLHESPVFQRIKARGQTSHSPLRESFGHWGNMRLVILALLGLVAGQAVIGYTTNIYSLFFLTQTLKVENATASLLVATAMLLTTPFLVVFGTISDRLGRKPIIMTGCLLAAVTFFPLFKLLTRYANPALLAAQERAPIKLVADPAECSFQFNPVGTSRFVTSCDIAKSYLANAGLSYRNEAGPPGVTASVHIGEHLISSYNGASIVAKDADKIFDIDMQAALKAGGYPSQAAPERVNKSMIVGILMLMMLFNAMAYGPIAAALVDLFPARIRYTSLSLPYHIGNGWFGGFLPASAFAISAATGDIYSGLWYPVIIAAVTFIVGLVFLKEGPGTSVDA